MQSERKIELVRWVYRMMSAWVADVGAITTLCALNFYYSTIASNNFYVHDQCVINSPEFQKWPKKSKEWLFNCFLPIYSIITIKIVTDLNRYWTVDSDNLWDLKYVPSLPGSWKTCHYVQDYQSSAAQYCLL